MVECICAVSINVILAILAILHNVHLHNRPDQHHIIEAAANNNISDVRKLFDSLDWSEENYRMLERIGQSAEQVYVCLSATDEVSV